MALQSDDDVLDGDAAARTVVKTETDDQESRKAKTKRRARIRSQS